MLKSFIALAVCILIAIFIGPIGAQEKTATPQAGSEQQEMRAEGEILAYLVAIDEHEIAAAREANQKSPNPNVQQYAQMMIRDYGKHLEDTQRLINRMNVQLRETPDIDKVRSEAEAARNKLAQLQGGSFNSAYIEQMVKDHAEALDRIDNHYIKATTNAQLLANLRETRSAVAKHHEEALRIQGILRK